VGVDVRYPFIKSSGGVDWIIEPRAQITQSFGDGRLENFSSSDSNGENTISTFQDGVNNKFSWTTRLRYDDDTDKFRRIDTGFNYRGERLSTGWRYYRIDSATNDAERANLVDTRLLDFDPLAPPEEVSGNVRLKLTDKWSLRYAANRDKWSLRYAANRDLDAKITRRQELGLMFQDDCTLVEFIYNRNNFDSDVIRDNQGFGIRVSLLTLGDFSPCFFK